MKYNGSVHTGGVKQKIYLKMSKFEILKDS